MFYDTNHTGHGLDFNAHKQGFSVFYYAHTSNGERLWLYSAVFKGDLEFGVPIELNMFEVINGTFGQPVLPKAFWGTLVIYLESCDSGHASFDGADGEMEMDFTRLTRLPGIDCQY